MESNNNDEEEEQQQIEAVETLSVASTAQPTDETHKDEQPQETSLIQSLLLKDTEELDEKKKKKKKKVKTVRQKEFERLTKATKTIFTSPKELNIVCERINLLLSHHKTTVLAACHSLDKLNSGRLPYEQFRLVIRDRLPKISAEDIFILTKLFEVEGLIDYRTILDEKLGNGILRYVTSLPVPQSKEIILEKKSSTIVQSSFHDHTKYVTIHLRLITFDSYNAYPGHIHLNVPDHISIYTLSKMIIDERDFATRSIDIFREKVPSRTNLLDPMRTLDYYHYIGAYVDGTHNQSFPTYTLYYDYSSMDVGSDCPILKCDYYMK